MHGEKHEGGATRQDGAASCMITPQSVADHGGAGRRLFRTVRDRLRRLASAQARRNRKTAEPEEAERDDHHRAVNHLHRVRLVGVIAKFFPHIERLA